MGRVIEVFAVLSVVVEKIVNVPIPPITVPLPAMIVPGGVPTGSVVIGGVPTGNPPTGGGRSTVPAGVSDGYGIAERCANRGWRPQDGRPRILAGNSGSVSCADGP